ncbi:MAG: heme ABC exporter ATP-binding protein CcmA [Thermoplasmata archaeon]
MSLDEPSPPRIRFEPSRPGPAVVECRGVSSGYRGHPVLSEITFSIREPAIYVVLGPNGSGKTTLFRTLAGILTPSKGRVEVDGLDIGRQEARDRLHFLSHIDGVPDGLRVEEALRFYATIEGATAQDVDRVLGLLELRELRGKFFSELSQGQKKRVSIARIFLRERGIYLLDEPTTNLDPKMATEIRSLLLGLSRQQIVLYSSHNLFEAREIGKFVLTLKAGKLAYFGRISDLRASRYVIGVRGTRVEVALPSAARQGDYFLQELSGPEEVPGLIRKLEEKGVKIRELREMENPLEDLFR